MFFLFFSYLSIADLYTGVKDMNVICDTDYSVSSLTVTIQLVEKEELNISLNNISNPFSGPKNIEDFDIALDTDFIQLCQ